MAKGRTAKSGVAPQRQESPIRPDLNPLTLDERAELRALIMSPVFVKAWNNAKLGKPTVFVAATQAAPAPLDSPLGMQIASNRLHEIRGWELYERALLRQLNDPVAPRTGLKENYQQP